MDQRRVLIVWVLAAVASACTWFGSPRERLGKLGVVYSADAFVAQAGEGDIQAVKLFLDSGMSPDVVDHEGLTPLTSAAAHAEMKTLALLLQKGAAVDPQAPRGPTPLTAAVHMGRSDIVQALLDAGADANTKDGDEESPLMLAIRGRHATVVKQLLEKGAQSWVQDEKWSALMLGSFLGDLQIVKLLLERDARVDAADERGMTALMHAAGGGHVDVVKALLAKRAAIEARDVGGHTALMFAANNGHRAAVEALLRAGANAAAANRNGQTAASYAAMNGYREVVELFQPGVDRRDRPSPASTTSQHLEKLPGIPAMEHARLTWPEDTALFVDAARTAWSFVDDHYQPSTGFTMPLGQYRFTTMWDVGGMLAAAYAARELGFISVSEYRQRVGRLLDTLTKLALYDQRAFNKWYDARTGARVDRGYERPDQFSGWSATDLGRLLVWLKLVADDPSLQAKATEVAQRLDFNRIVHDGYLWGEDLDSRGRQRVFQEGRIGYEQYAASGFALWGHRAEKALRLDENALPLTVMGEPLVADYRRWDRLTSEPFLLQGLELGWDRRTELLVRRLLKAQEQRYERTGRVTIVGEDSVALPPHYFYYYCLYSNGRQFAIDVADRSAVVDNPRWVSAKSALAFHALMPSRYTDTAVRSLDAARQKSGWASGVYEGTSTPTGSISINTAAVIMTAAVVHISGEPVLAHIRRAASE